MVVCAFGGEAKLPHIKAAGKHGGRPLETVF